MAPHRGNLGGRGPGGEVLRLSGMGVSPGIAIGQVHIRETGTIEVAEYSIARRQVEAELERFDRAVDRSRDQIELLATRSRELPDAAAEEVGFLLDAYRQMLRESRLVRGVRRRIAEERINAEAAVQAELSEISQAFLEIKDSYLAARLDDIQEVAKRLVRNLSEKSTSWFSTLPRGSIVMAEEITPADTALMDPKRVAGFVTMLGGAEGHTAIMARALGIPAVIGVPGFDRRITNGDTVIVDGDTGTVLIGPTDKQRDSYRKRQAGQQAEKRRLARLVRAHSETRDGVPVTLQANVELPVEMDLVRRNGAQGIGLLRTEFMFMNRDDLPGEEEQYVQFRAMLEKLEGRPLSIRTLDVGGEKIAHGISGRDQDSSASVLGLRGIRLSLAHRDLLETQLAAILRAAVHGPVRIILPMISSATEIRQVRRIMAAVHERLKTEGIAVPETPPPLGVMIEVPGAALSADALARHADFFAIGSNDLTMYTLAIDRSDERVASLYDPLHPGVLRLIQFSTMAALRARIPVSICGEMAGDPRFTALLLGLGIHILSMSPPSLLRVKKRVRQIDLAAASERANLVVSSSDSGRISTLIDDFNGAFM